VAGWALRRCRSRAAPLLVRYSRAFKEEAGSRDCCPRARESRAILLAGVALNWIGAVKLAREVWLRERCADPPADYDQLKAFAAGTAATFGAFYLYLYVNDEPAVPLLMFGASLKTWAFVLSVVLRAQNRLDRENLVSFGVSNGVVGGLFWVHILRSATADRTD
jgi:hypothetical protein